MTGRVRVGGSRGQRIFTVQSSRQDGLKWESYKKVQAMIFSTVLVRAMRYQYWKLWTSSSIGNTVYLIATKWTSVEKKWWLNGPSARNQLYAWYRLLCLLYIEKWYWMFYIWLKGLEHSFNSKVQHLSIIGLSVHSGWFVEKKKKRAGNIHKKSKNVMKIWDKVNRHKETFPIV